MAMVHYPPLENAITKPLKRLEQSRSLKRRTLSMENARKFYKKLKFLRKSITQAFAA